MRVLLVEDEVLIAIAQASTLRKLGHDVVGIASDSGNALDLAREHSPDILILDVHLPGESDGIEIGNSIREFLDCQIVFVTGYTDSETLERARALQPRAILEKPVVPSDLGAALP